MAEDGRQGEAIGYSVMASTVGGVIGWVAAVSLVPTIESIALYSEPADIALIGIAGLVLVSAFVRGVDGAWPPGVLIGLMLASVGFDPQDGVERYKFSLVMIVSGISYAPVIVGFLAFCRVVKSRNDWTRIPYACWEDVD